MTFANDIDTAKCEIVRIVEEMAGSELAKFWRELARPVTFFEEASPAHSLLEVSRKRRTLMSGRLV
jgi:hypothetical protein